MTHFLVTYQRELACGAMTNNDTLVVGGSLNVLFFFFVFFKTIQAARYAARGQLHRKEAMVLPIYDTFLKCICVALILRSASFLVFPGQSSSFNFFEWIVVNPFVGGMRDALAVFMYHKSAGVDAVRRTVVFAILWGLIHGLVGLNYWLDQVDNVAERPSAESAYWAVHSGIIMTLHAGLCTSAYLRRRKLARSRSTAPGAATMLFRDSLFPYSAFVFVTFLLFYFTLLTAFPDEIAGCWYMVTYVSYFCFFPGISYLVLRMDSGYWRNIGVSLSFQAIHTAQTSRSGRSSRTPLVIDFSRVQIGPVIASGATAVVCTALLDAKSDVAIKKYTCTTLTLSDAQAYIREVSVLASLRHPNIVTLYGVCVQPPYMCLVVELMKNGSLFDVLADERDALAAQREAAVSSPAVTVAMNSQVGADGNAMAVPLLPESSDGDTDPRSDARGELTPLLRLQLMHDAWTGLAFLHGCDPPVYHGDIKSLNLLISANWVLKLADFGESRLWTDTPSHGTAARAGGATATQHGSGHQSQTAARERNGAGIAAGPAIRSASTADDDRGNRRQALVRLAELPALNPAFRVIEERHSGRAALPAAAESRGYTAPEAAVPPPSGLPPRPRKPRSTGRRSYASAAQVAPSTRGTAALTRRRAAASSASLVVSKAASAVKPDAALYKATPQWSAPETFVGDHTYSAAADVFSMGLVMWEMWALNTPYHQVAPHEVPSVIVSGRRPAIPASMPRSVAALVQQCWSHHPLARPTAASVAAALGELVAAHSE